jgi:hypothetical protein
LSSECLGTVEAPLVTQPVAEQHAELLSVKVFMKSEDVYLQGGLMTVEGGSAANVHHAVTQLTVVADAEHILRPSLPKDHLGKTASGTHEREQRDERHDDDGQRVRRSGRNGTERRKYAEKYGQR